MVLKHVIPPLALLLHPFPETVYAPTRPRCLRGWGPPPTQAPPGWGVLLPCISYTTPPRATPATFYYVDSAYLGNYPRCIQDPSRSPRLYRRPVDTSVSRNACPEFPLVWGLPIARLDYVPSRRHTYARLPVYRTT